MWLEDDRHTRRIINTILTGRYIVGSGHDKTNWEKEDDIPNLSVEYLKKLSDNKLILIAEGAVYPENHPAIEAAKNELAYRKKSERYNVPDYKPIHKIENSSFVNDLHEVLQTVTNFLLEKNRKYGDSVLTPIQCFSKLSAEEGINIRLDDKIKRLISGQPDDTEDTEMDLLGYLIIKQILKLRRERNNAET